MLIRYFVFIVVFICCYTLSAQDRADNTSWTSISFSHAIDDNWTAVLKPIHRSFEDLGTYQNSSLDYIIRRKWNGNYASQILGRTWFIPNGTNRQFIFIDFLQSLSVGDAPLKWKNRYRLHIAFDIEERIDADFFRFDSQLTLSKPWKVIPFISAEPFFRLDGDNKEIQRIRYIVGGKWKINDGLSLSGQYWRESYYNNNTNPDINIWVLNLGFKL